MNADQILAEIREANLSYLMLAQSLINDSTSRLHASILMAGRHQEAA